MNRKQQLLKYVLADLVTAAVAWTLFYIFRKVYIDPKTTGTAFPIDFGNLFFLSLIAIPLCWLLFYYVSGYYREVFRKSRLAELWHTFLQTLFGVIVLFFAVILDDIIHTYSNYYLSFTVLFLLHFTLTYFTRLGITSRITYKIHNRLIGFNTLLIGSDDNAVDVYLEMENQKKSSGNRFIGFVHVNGNTDLKLSSHLSHLGSVENVRNIIQENNIREVIIALESTEHDKIGKIINKLIDTNVLIKAIPSMYDIVTGRVKMTGILGTPLIQISHQLMPAWQEYFKNTIDICASLLAIILLSPLIAFLIIGVKLSSAGPIFYSHERIGRFGKPFRIYKFRSMHVGAETNGPELSSKNDNRVTRFGRFMRQYRLDEIPNLFNVLRGDMSLVGPRPERRYFIEKIMERAPHYVHLLKIKPGVTSWGQVKYGYAENVDQMLKRLKYDLIYLDNMTLYVDFKILIYTILTIMRREGV